MGLDYLNDTGDYYIQEAGDSGDEVPQVLSLGRTPYYPSAISSYQTIVALKPRCTQEITIEYYILSQASGKP